MILSCASCIFFRFSGNDRPIIKDLDNYVVKDVADRWRYLGIQLLDPFSGNDLNIIEKNHPLNVVGCCHSMFQKWLETKPDATWNQLLLALKSPCVELNHLADQIEQKLRHTCK